MFVKSKLHGAYVMCTGKLSATDTADREETLHNMRFKKEEKALHLQGFI